MNSLSANPYPSMGLADIQNSLSAMKNALNAYEALSPEDITKFPGTLSHAKRILILIGWHIDNP